jgi:hypothetical protein
MMTRRLGWLGILLALTASAAADVDKRPLPDYDGRGEPPLTAGDALLWVPRALASPLYLVSEYAVRRPMSYLVITGEREQWVQKVTDFFTTDDGKLGAFPIFYVERGYHPVAGVYAFADDLVAPGNALRLSGSLGFGHRDATVTDRLVRGPLRLGVTALGADADDHAFYGLGPSSREEDRARYGLRRYQASATAEVRAGALTAVAEAGWRDVALRGSTCCDDPAVMPDVPGFADYHGAFERLQLVVDTRGVRGDGVRLALDVEHGPSWTRATGQAAASAGIGRGRVVSLGVTATDVEGGDGDVPLPELATVGGGGPLPGFGGERLVGRSALSAAVQYEWPVWVWLDGAVYFGAGDVFGERWDGLELDLMRLSGGVGLRTSNSPDVRFEVLLAAGTAPLRDGAGVETLRVVVGATHAF